MAQVQKSEMNIYMGLHGVLQGCRKDKEVYGINSAIGDIGVYSGMETEMESTKRASQLF